MREADFLDKQFCGRLQSGVRLSIEITEAGLVLGAATLLARMDRDGHGISRLADEEERERLLALLSVVQRRPFSANKLPWISASLDDWQRGEKAVAHIRLAQAHLPRLIDIHDAYRLFLAETLLDQGMTPRALMKALGLDASPLDLIKYDPDQRRVPAGNGRESGRWGPGGGGSSQAFLAPAAGAAARAGARTLLAGAMPSALEALTTFAARFSVPTAVLGALFIPTPNSGGVTQGALPDAPGVRFKQDGPAGTLRLTATAADGSSVIVAAQNRGGIYVDVRTGEPLGRNLGGQLYLDSDSVQNAIRAGLAPGQELTPDERPGSKDDDPKLCPAPELDTPHGSSERAKDYEDDVHARVNPLAPLPRGYGVNLLDPATGRIVYYEDCFRYAGDLVDGEMQKGDLAEAKGLGYEWRIRAGGDRRKEALEELEVQAQKQLRTADAVGRGLKWYFAEPYAADQVRDYFRDHGLERIIVAAMPPRKH